MTVRAAHAFGHGRGPAVVGKQTDTDLLVHKQTPVPTYTACPHTATLTHTHPNVGQVCVPPVTVFTVPQSFHEGCLCVVNDCRRRVRD